MGEQHNSSGTAQHSTAQHAHRTRPDGQSLTGGQLATSRSTELHRYSTAPLLPSWPSSPWTALPTLSDLGRKARYRWNAGWDTWRRTCRCTAQYYECGPQWIHRSEPG